MNPVVVRTIAVAVLSMIASPVATQTVAQQELARLKPPAAQASSASAAPTRLTLDDAVRLALQNNLDIAVDRLEPQLAQQRVSQASAAYLPSMSGVFGRTHAVQPPSNLLVNAEGTVTDAFSSTLAVGQRLPWAGTTYNVSWNASRQTTNSFFQSFSPNLGSIVQVSFSQPLLRDLAIDSTRQQLIITKRNKEMTDTRFRETVVRTLADVKRAYWNLVSARASVGVQQKALDLARELVRTNTARVDVGSSPPLDLLSAKAEQAQREENLVVAQVQARQAEDALRIVIFDQNSPSFWTEGIEPTDSTPVGAPLPDIEAVVQRALRTRQDLIRARDEVANAETSVKFYQSQRLPDLRAQAAYGATGLGGTRWLRTGGFPGTISGTELTSFGSVMNQVFSRNFPSWSVGLTLSYPIGYSFEEAGLANARVQEAQARVRLQNAETRAVRQLRQAAWQMEANTKRIETSRAAREFAEQRLDAEQKRYDVGMSTSFLVVQAQRDLAQARNNELAAALDYVRAMIDFEALQEASPAGGSTGSSMTVSGGSVVSFPSVASATTTSSSSSTTAATSGRPGGM
jgi:outer membrane protein TolC